MTRSSERAWGDHRDTESCADDFGFDSVKQARGVVQGSKRTRIWTGTPWLLCGEWTEGDKDRLLDTCWGAP